MNRILALTFVAFLSLSASACRGNRSHLWRHFFGPNHAAKANHGRPTYSSKAASATGAAAQSSVTEPGPLEFEQYPWLKNCPLGCLKANATLRQHFVEPQGYLRVANAPRTFGEWLRTLPLAAPGTVVNDDHGKPALVTTAGRVAAVVAIDMHAEDSADALLRLHAEWKFSAGERASISYASNSGRLMPFGLWIAGERIVARKQDWAWVYKTTPSANPTYADLRNFLDAAYQWTDPRALAIQGTAPDALDVSPGDYFVHAGKDPTLVIVLDVAKNSAGEPAMLLGHVAAPHQYIYVMQASKGTAWFTPRPNQEIAAPGLRPFVWKEHRRLPKSMIGNPI